MEVDLKILFISSEITPFSRTGGLGDVAGALPKALKNLGHEIRVVTPFYRSVKERRYGLRDVARLSELSIEIGGKTMEYSVKSGFLVGSKVQTYFITSKDMYRRKGIYVDPKTGKDFIDNHLRYGFLNHVALHLMADLNWIPDIIHCSDWQASLVPYLIRKHDSYRESFEPARTLLHLHNVGFQGLFPMEVASEIGVNPSDVEVGGVSEFYQKLSFLKSGVCCADKIVTVSPTYSEEIRSSAEYGCGLEDLYEERRSDLSGIINGINRDVWNPEKDESIDSKYTVEDFIEGKAANKEALQKELNLPVDPDIPVVAMIARLTEQKGFKLLEQVSDELLDLPVQFVFLGEGEKKYRDMLKDWHESNPDKVSPTIKFDNRLSHKIEAGADIFLMPSKYEPCGLNQLYSLAYGTVPIVRKTGGLADSIEPIQDNADSGTGFVFDEYNAETMITTLKEALDLFGDKSEWNKLQLRCMNEDFSWEASALQFEEVYSAMLSEPAFCK